MELHLVTDDDGLDQFGLGRAGFYSYELLERLIGISSRVVR